MKKRFRLIDFFLVISLLIVSCSKDDSSIIKEENAGCDCDKKFETFVDSRDGHVYKTIIIGNQTWMAENMAYLPELTKPSINSASSPCYYVYGFTGTDVNRAKSLENYAKYGVLYNWSAATIVSPANWHLPSADEWDILENYLSNNDYSYWPDGEDIAKSMASDSDWNYYSVEGTIGNESVNNNRSCFSALPGGFFFENGKFVGINECIYLWSSTPNEIKYAWFRNLEDHNSYLGGTVSGKEAGFSIRCIKD
jgi:uncharacterized protein (TIGR02145 family)